MTDIKFEIVRELAVLSEGTRGWRKELNLVSWNGNEAKLDIRDWGPEHSRAGKGLTLTEDEGHKLWEALTSYEGD